jgi:hypothetical protein
VAKSAKKRASQRSEAPKKPLPVQREMLFGYKKPKGKGPAKAPAQAPAKRETWTQTGIVDERAIDRMLQASYAGAMGRSAPPAIVREIIKEARKRKSPRQVQQLIARFVPGSSSTILPIPEKGHWVIPRVVRREQVEQPCSAEQLEWARACIRASRRQKKIKTSGKRLRAVKGDYLAGLARW